MFKKATVLMQQKLRGSDVKRLKKDMQLAFNLSDEELDSAVPNRSDVIMTKWSNRALVYAVDGRNPLVFDPVRGSRRVRAAHKRGALTHRRLTHRAAVASQEGNNDLYPTVYLLWSFPKALPSLLTYSEVSPKLLGGADLMLQGLITPEAGLGEWKEGDARCVALPDNDFPFAVGSMVVSSDSLAKTGLKGRGLKLLHHFPDT